MHALFMFLRTSQASNQRFQPITQTMLAELGSHSHIDFVKPLNFMAFSDSDLAHLPNNLAVTIWYSRPPVLAAIWQTIRPSVEASSESWLVLMEPVKLTGNFTGFQPTAESAPPLDNAAPMAVLIWGILTPAGRTPFYAVAPDAYEQARVHPAYLGGVFLTQTGVETGSFSCWRSKRDAAAYAFGPGAHHEVMTADRQQAWHDPTTDFFARFRILAAQGTLFGTNPLASVAPQLVPEAFE
jgi:hypothetical protein